MERIESTKHRDQMPVAKEGAGGVSIGLYSPDGSIEKSKVFRIKKHQEFCKYIALSNFINFKRNYLLIAIVDCKQAQFSIHGKLYRSYPFTMAPNETIEIPVKIDGLKEGFHDVIFVIFKAPDRAVGEGNMDIASALQQIYTLRNNVIVGTGFPFEPELTNVKPVVHETNNANFDDLFISKSKDIMKVWYTERAKSKEIKYYIHVGNLTNERISNYAVIAFLDWEQVPISRTDEVLYFSLARNEKKVYQGILEIPSNIIEKDKLSFTSLLIPQPFSALEHAGNVSEINQSLRTTILRD